jgi:hypothetical protein
MEINKSPSLRWERCDGRQPITSDGCQAITVVVCEATEERKQADRDERHKRTVETLQRRKADHTLFQMKCGGEQCIYYVTVYTGNTNLSNSDHSS